MFGFEFPANEDYVEISESIVIEPNQTRVVLTVPILNDGILERNESFTVQLVAGENIIIEEDYVTVWIVDDDGNRIVALLICVILLWCSLHFQSCSSWI